MLRLLCGFAVLHAACGRQVVFSNASEVHSPLQMYSITSDGVVVGAYAGSDPFDCFVKDPNGSLAKSGESGYVELMFQLERPQLSQLVAHIFAPDQMADSFWAAIDLRADAATDVSLWSIPHGNAYHVEWELDVFAPKSAADRRLEQQCHHFGAGNHSLRLHTREPGAGIEYLVVQPAPKIVLVEPPACGGGCKPEGGSLLRATVGNLCGPDTLASHLRVSVAGKPCTDLTYLTQNVVSCRSPPYDGSMAEVLVEQGLDIEGGSTLKTTVKYDASATVDEGVVITASVVSGALGLALLIAGAMFWNNRRKHQQRVERMYGAATIAADMAEAVAVLDFKTLEKLHDLENPDRVQTAMKSILLMMQEFVKYIPQHVIQTVRGEADDSSHSDNGGLSKPSTVELTQSPNPHRRSTSRGDTQSVVSSTHTKERENKGRDDIGPRRGSVSDETSRAALANLDVMHMKSRQRVLVMCVRPHVAYDKRTAAESTQQEFLKTVLFCSGVSKGCVHKVLEDSVVVTWGAVGTLVTTSPVAKAMRAATGINDSQHHCGVYSAPSLCCYLGNTTTQTFHILGGAVAEADVLARTAQATRAPTLCAAALLNHSSVTKNAPFFPVTSSQGRWRPLDTVVVFECQKSMPQGEWMYCLQALDESKLGVESALRMLLEQHDLAAACNIVHETVAADAQLASKFLLWFAAFITTLSPQNFTPPVLEVTLSGTIIMSSAEAVSELPHGVSPFASITAQSVDSTTSQNSSTPPLFIPC